MTALPSHRQTAVRPPLASRLMWACGLLLFTLLLCLVPKPENDLFFELRIGTDILRTHHLPHMDTYSWTRAGTPWVVPEWGAFVLYAAAWRAGGFLGTWLLMTAVVLAAAWTVCGRLQQSLPPAAVFGLTCLVLLCLSDFVQERPYVFTYLLLGISLRLVTACRERDAPLSAFWPLLPLCIVWTNLHQGVVTIIGLLLAYTLGDSILWLRFRPDARALHRRRAAQMLTCAIACAIAATATPYGWHIYQNIFVTIHNPQLMANVTEWRSLMAVPGPQLVPFILLLCITVAAYALSPRRTLPDALVLLALAGQAVPHARGIPLFAVGASIVAAPYYADLLRRLPARTEGTAPHPWRNPLLASFAAFYALIFCLVTWVNLRQAAGPHGLSLQGIGEAVARVPSYPWAACAFVEREQFPLPLRLFNNFEIGGFLMWRLPQQPVFVDGRLDVYAGQTFDDMLTLSRAGGTPTWSALVQRYNLDCVMTTSTREARAFAADPQWQQVYADPVHRHRPRCRILLRRRPQYAALIARCLRDAPPALPE